jgi:acyl-CoA synthetase (AMP-forming)/AMP-acid ligase II
VFLPGRLLPFAGSGRPGVISVGYLVTGIPVRPGSIDRAKDMIITGGFSVYSAEVEQTLMEHPAVRERIGSVKTPMKIEIWPDLPRSRVGKVLKNEIKAQLLR